MRNFIEHKIPDERGTKLKTYIVNSVFNGETTQGEYWQSNPAIAKSIVRRLGRGMVSVLGRYDAIRTVSTMLDYVLAHGTTPANWS